MIISFNNWNIITFSHKATKSEAFEDIYQVVLDGISGNMSSLVQPNNFGAMNKIDTSKMGYYVIKFVSEVYNLRDNTKCNVQIISAGELVVKAQNLICTKEKTNWYWDQKKQQKVIIVPI